MPCSTEMCAQVIYNYDTIFVRESAPWGRGVPGSNLQTERDSCTSDPQYEIMNTEERSTRDIKSFLQPLPAPWGQSPLAVQCKTPRHFFTLHFLKIFLCKIFLCDFFTTY